MTIIFSVLWPEQKRPIGYKPRYLAPNTAKNPKENIGVYRCFYSFTHLFGNPKPPSKYPMYNTLRFQSPCTIFDDGKTDTRPNEVRSIQFRTNPGQNGGIYLPLRKKKINLKRAHRRASTDKMIVLKGAQ